jgi:hypothetical protein
MEKKLAEQEKITNKILNEKEQLEKQLASEKKTFLTTADKLNNYVSELEQKLVNLQVNEEQQAKVQQASLPFNPNK